MSKKLRGRRTSCSGERVVPNPHPRYDSVFFDGMEALNAPGELGGEVVVFDPCQDPVIGPIMRRLQRVEDRLKDVEDFVVVDVEELADCD